MPNHNGTHTEGATAVKEMATQQGQAIKNQTASAVDSVKDKVLNVVDDRKDHLVDQAQSIRETATKVADDLARDGMEKPADWLRQAADSFDKMVDSVEKRDAQQLISDATSAVRGQPLVFAGMMLGLGFAAARILSAARPPAPRTFNNAQPNWPTLNNPAPYARPSTQHLGQQAHRPITTYGQAPL